MTAITNKLKERFCWDCKIPIKIFKDPYFMVHMGLLDPLYGSIDKYALFRKELERFGTEQEYFEHYNKVKDTAMQTIRESEGYKRFIAEDMNAFAVDEKLRSITSNDVYKETNKNKIMMSIDMRQANYSVMAYYDNSIFGADSWESFIGRFTDSQHIINSKYIREVVLGNCNAGRQVTYEKYMMSLLLKDILSVVPELECKILSFSNDEVVFDITGFDCDIAQKLADVTRAFEVGHERIRFRTEIFEIEQIESGYVKRFSKLDEVNGEKRWVYDGRYQLKKVEAVYVPITVARYCGLPVREEYKVFVYNGRLAKFID